MIPCLITSSEIQNSFNPLPCNVVIRNSNFKYEKQRVLHAKLEKHSKIEFVVQVLHLPSKVLFFYYTVSSIVCKDYEKNIC